MFRGDNHMDLPSPYFENIEGIGSLEVEEVLVDYVYPLLMTMKDDRGNRYLCACFDTRGCQQWILVRIPTVDLINMLTDKLTLYDAFLSQQDFVHIAYDYQTKEENITFSTNKTVPLYWLPTKGEYLEAEKDEFKDFITKLQIEIGGKQSMDKNIVNADVEVTLRVTLPLELDNSWNMYVEALNVIRKDMENSSLNPILASLSLQEVHSRTDVK